jgi:cytochrome c biogenesis protein CcdA
MDILSLGAALLAGVLTILSPCVLPILPILFGAAAGRNRYAPVALAVGLAAGFTAIGLFLATIGFALGLDAAVFRTGSAAALILVGAILVVPRGQRVVQAALAPVGAWADRRSAAIDGRSGGLATQFGLGLLLGLVWSPCAGPTLGAASLLAARGEALGSVALTMLLFGFGAALPLLLFGLAGRAAMRRMRGGLGAAGRAGKLLLGAGLLVAGVLVLTGFDKRLEIWALDHGPGWATEWSTRF